MSKHATRAEGLLEDSDWNRFRGRDAPGIHEAAKVEATLELAEQVGEAAGELRKIREVLEDFQRRGLPGERS